MQIINPKFDVEKVKKATYDQPIWLHFGAGNLFRAFPAVLQQGLIERGLSDKGIIVCEAFDEEIIEKVYTPYDNTHLSVTLNADGTKQKRMIASITEALAASESYIRLKEICAKESLQIISFTITEKGYQSSIIELVAMLCRERFKAGELPIALLSLDNCSKNGDVLKAALLSKTTDEEFIKYLNNSYKVSFPLSMIDKITPRPSEDVAKSLAEEGFPNTEIFVTSKNTYVAPFVNAEAVQYLAIEDKFPNGRPPLERESVIFCDRETVDRIEAMKVRTALNPLHTAMSVFARLFGYEYIYEAMQDDSIKRFIIRLGYGELMPMVVNPGVIEPLKFMNEVITERFPNPCIPDMPERILCDTSQKIPVRFGETLKAYAENDAKALSELTLIPLVFAGWLKYLTGLNDKNEPFKLSPDPMLNELTALEPEEILLKTEIFGIDLYEFGLAEKILDMFEEMSSLSVRETFEKYIT
ncbi:MAG: mannitol dehydrogenase family protein [Oscillospiraceae bacterium]|nr:mannitol dehydrogenase family protein [Oscillospiraceae bacterium]